MHGVVLAAGEGTRMRPLTADRPKGLVEVAGKPLLTRCFEQLLALGVDGLVVVVGYRGEDIVARYGDSFAGVPVAYAWQSERDGLAHAVAAAEDHVAGDFLVMNGDNVYDGDLSGLVETHRRSGADATLLVDDVSVERATRTGVLAFDPEGRVEGVVEKPDDPPSTEVLRGCHAFSPRIFDACRAVEPSTTGEYELAAAIDRLLSAGATVERVRFDGWCLNVNTPADRATADRRLTPSD